MTPEQRAAYIFAQSVSAMAEIEGMKAENSDRLSKGLSIAYGDEAFFAVPEKFGITHNQILSLINE